MLILYASLPRSAAIRMDRKLRSMHVIDMRFDQFMVRGIPNHVTSDNDG